MSLGSSRRGSILGAICVLGLLAALSTRYTSSGASGFVGGLVSGKAGQRCTKVQMAGVDKRMKERIISVTKTGKLTDAMRMVAAAKVRRAQDGVEKSRPFSDELTSMIKGIVKKLKGSGLEAELPMLRAPEKVTNVGILIITGDRGLCGAYNTFVLKLAKKRIEELNSQGIVPKLILVGRKSLLGVKIRFKELQFNDTGKYFRMPDTIKAKAAAEIGDAVSNLFLSGEVDKIEVIYGKFLNLLTNKATIRTMLPLSPTGIEDPEDETFVMTTEEGQLKVKKEKTSPVKAKEIESDVIFDQPPEVILNSMLPLYLNSQLLSLLFDAQASELSSRMIAMKAATDNAKELVRKLTLIYNKKRQAAITQEICEVSAGALALEDAGDKGEGPKMGIFDDETTVEQDLLAEIESGSVLDMARDPADVFDETFR